MKNYNFHFRFDLEQETSLKIIIFSLAFYFRVRQGFFLNFLQIRIIVFFRNSLFDPHQKSWKSLKMVINLLKLKKNWNASNLLNTFTSPGKSSKFAGRKP